ncbi:MAG: hypothetical protein ACW974_08020 [Candidatus Thorarchaeota archaeon]
MITIRKSIIIVSVVSLLVLSGFLVLSVYRASVPDDVRGKLGQDLIERIENGTIFTIHDCIIMCSSPEDTDTVVDTLPSESIETVWEYIGGFHAFLTPDQIFSIARMDEVVRIDYNAMMSTFPNH